MTKAKLDFEAASELSYSIIGSESGPSWKNLGACYLALLKENEEMRATLEFCALKLSWEKNRCGDLQEPLRSALLKAKETLERIGELK